MQLVLIFVIFGLLSNPSDTANYFLRLSRDRGLIYAEERAITDLHNALRRKQARGDVRNQPRAADMVRLEWSTSLARRAQKWANQCGGDIHDDHAKYGQGQNYASHPNRTILVKSAFKGWFDDEYPHYQYGRPPGIAGHYTQIVTAYTHKIGCGANKCPNHRVGRLVCNFMIGGNLHDYAPFKRGPPCSKCPKGFGYCKDSLCSSARQCRRNRRCRCTIVPKRCARHGHFRADTCECLCNIGWTGLNCDQSCKDTDDKQCAPRAKQGECKPGEWSTDMLLYCPASCKLCKRQCKNKLKKCKDLKEWGNCKDAPEYMMEFCPRECNTC